MPDRFSAGGLAPMQAGVSGGTAGAVMGGMMGGTGVAAGGSMGGGLRRIGGGVTAEDFERSVTPNTTTAAYDDYFAYSLTDPITIRKNESALVPILQTRLPVERVTLWSPVQPTALRALWITNDSKLTLDRGSFSIVENGSFGGEGLLDAVHPGERRLLSYAADQAVHVTVDYRNNSRRVERLTISRGVLTESSIEVREVEYLVHNAAPEARVVVVEQPALQGWTLDSEVKPAEATATAYRFRVSTQPLETVRLHIGQRHTLREEVRLVDRSEDQLVLLLDHAKVSAATRAQLQPAFDAHHAVMALDDQIRAKDAAVASITSDQSRIRENLAALKGTAEEKALATRYTGELNQQEDQLQALRRELEGLHTQRTAADLEFQNRLAALNVDERIS